MQRPVTVLLVEDHPVVLKGLQAICAEEPTLHVVGEARSAADALSRAEHLQPDVAVVPIRLDGTRSGIELCRSIKTVCRARVVVFTSYTRKIDKKVAMLAGADALVSKAGAVQDLVDAILGDRAGGSWAVQDAWSRIEMLHDFELELPLTSREGEILQLLAEGLTNPEIAALLMIEVSTVKTHVRSVMRKLGVGSRRQLFIER